MFCKNCGNQIEDNAKFCSFCGANQQNADNASEFHAPNEEKRPYNTMCIIGLVISGISLLLNFFGIVGIAGTIISVLGLIGCGKKNEKGKVLAIIGIVIGVFSILYGLIMILSISV